MPNKKTVAGLIFLFVAVDVGVIFWIMTRSHSSPMPLKAGQSSNLVPKETFRDLPIPKNIACDRVVIEKSSRTMILYRGTESLKSYRVALGGNPLGHKEFEGDQKTPEGIYHISGRNPKSDFHLSLRISYPNATDTLHAQSQGKSPGGDIMIHGLPNGFTGVGTTHCLVDWTAGCVAVNDEEIEEIWRTVPDGTTVEIRP